MARVRVAACQINTVVGDLDGNADRILAALAEAEAAGADLAVFPELTVTGYPPEDLLSRPAFVADNLAAFDRIAAATGAVCRGGRLRRRRRPIGPPASTPRPSAPAGEVARPLPQAPAPQLRGLRRAALVRPRRARSPVRGGRRAGRASPSARTCGSRRARWPSRPRPAPGCWSTSTPRPTRGAGATSGWPCWPTGWRRPAAPSSTSTRWAARTSWSSTGRRWWWPPTGTLVASAAQFAEEVLVVDLEVDGTERPEPPTPGADRRSAPPSRRGHGRRPPPAAGLAPVLGPEAEVYEALVLGTRDYLAKNGFTDAVIGLSGGHRLVAGGGRGRRRPRAPSHVHGVTMPSRVLERGLGDRRRGAGRQPRASTSTRWPSSRPTGPSPTSLAAAARRRARRPDRREPAVADPRRPAHGAVQRPGLDRAHHRQQERDGHRLLDPLRRLGRRVRRDQGRAQDPGLRSCAATATARAGLRR